MNTAKTLILVAAMAASSAAMALTGTTKDGYPACLTKDLLDNFMTFSAANDTASMQAYLDQQRCLNLRGGITVTVTDAPGVFGSVVGFTFQGIEFFAPREALDYDI